MMQRTNTYELKPTKEQKKILLEMCVLSGAVFNMANYKFRQSLFRKEKVKRFFSVQKQLQSKPEYQRLGRSYSLPMLQKHSELVSDFFKAIKSAKVKHRVGMPKYYKNRKTNTTLPAYLAMDNCQYRIRGRKAFMPLGRQMRKETGLKGLTIEFNNKPRWGGKQQRGEVHYNPLTKKWHLYQTVEVKEPKQRKRGKIVAVDLGIKRFMVAYSSGKTKFYENNLWDRWAAIGEKIAKLKQIAKGRNGRYTTKRIRRLFLKRSRMVDNHFKDISHNLFCTYPDAKRIVVGNITGIRMNSDSKSAKANAMMHNHWSYASLLKRLKNKAEENGAGFEMIDEAYTTQTCPRCGILNTPQNRNYTCTCGFSGDRDAVGATNIYRNYIGNQPKTRLPLIGDSG